MTKDNEAEKTAKDSDSRKLVLLITLAIAFSISGTLVTLSNFPNGITGFASDSETGSAQFTVAALTQITLSDNSVNFGTCSLNSTNKVAYDSNSTTGSSVNLGAGYASGLCTGATRPDNMTLENTGNKYVNLTIRSSLNAMNFTNSSSGTGSFLFVGINKEANACSNTLTSTFTNFTVANNNYSLCKNFSPINTNDELFIAYRIILPPDTREQTSKSTTITLTAEDSAQ